MPKQLITCCLTGFPLYAVDSSRILRNLQPRTKHYIFDASYTDLQKATQSSKLKSPQEIALLVLAHCYHTKALGQLVYATSLIEFDEHTLRKNAKHIFVISRLFYRQLGNCDNLAEKQNFLKRFPKFNANGLAPRVAGSALIDYLTKTIWSLCYANMSPHIIDIELRKELSYNKLKADLEIARDDYLRKQQADLVRKGKLGNSTWGLIFRDLEIELGLLPDEITILRQELEHPVRTGPLDLLSKYLYALENISQVDGLATLPSMQYYAARMEILTIKENLLKVKTSEKLDLSLANISTTPKETKPKLSISQTLPSALEHPRQVTSEIILQPTNPLAMLQARIAKHKQQAQAQIEQEQQREINVTTFVLELVHNRKSTVPDAKVQKATKPASYQLKNSDDLEL